MLGGEITHLNIVNNIHEYHIVMNIIEYVLRPTHGWVGLIR